MTTGTSPHSSAFTIYSPPSSTALDGRRASGCIDIDRGWYSWAAAAAVIGLFLTVVAALGQPQINIALFPPCYPAEPIR